MRDPFDGSRYCSLNAATGRSGKKESFIESLRRLDEAYNRSCDFRLPAEETTEPGDRPDGRDRAAQSEIVEIGDVARDRRAVAVLIAHFPRAAAHLQAAAPGREAASRRPGRNELRSALEALTAEEHDPLLAVVVVAVVAVLAVP